MDHAVEHLTPDNLEEAQAAVYFISKLFIASERTTLKWLLV